MGRRTHSEQTTAYRHTRNKTGPKITLKDACERDMWLNDKQSDMEGEDQHDREQPDR